MADIALDDGVATVVATPHVRPDYPAVVPKEVPQRVAALREALSRYSLDINVVSGAELDIGAAIALDDEHLRAVTLGANGRDLLVETPHGRLPHDFEDSIENLQARGFRITLAHPELNTELQQQPERLEHLVSREVLVQLTASSLIGGRRSRARAAARHALEAGWAHAVASDAHAPRWRPPTLRSQVAEASRQLSNLGPVLEWAITESPQAILAGGELPKRPASQTRRRFLFGR